MKKVLVLVLAAIMLLGCTACGGSDFEKSLFFNVDFSEGNFNDKCEETPRSANGEITFEDDAEIGKKVAVFKEAVVAYDLKERMQNMTAGDHTMEAYVNVKKQGGFGVICGTYWYNSKTGSGFGAGKFDLGEGDSAGVNKVLSMFEGNGFQTTSVGGGEYNTWVHLVYVHQGEKSYYYVNGQLAADGEITSPQLVPYDSTAGFRIGAYNSLAQFPIGEFRAAFVRLYAAPASAEEVAKLYEARNA